MTYEGLGRCLKVRGPGGGSRVRRPEERTPIENILLGYYSPLGFWFVLIKDLHIEGFFIEIFVDNCTEGY